MNVKFYFIKYKLLFHLRIGDPIYCLPKKKHDFQALHNFPWNVVKYLGFFSALDCYNSITFNSSFMVSSRCVRAASGSDNLAAMQAQRSLSAKNADGWILGCCNCTGVRGAAGVYAGEDLCSLPAFSRSDPALRRWWGLQMSKETNVCRSFLSFGRQAARTFTWHLSVVPKKPTLSRLLFFFFPFPPLQRFRIVVRVWVCMSVCLVILRNRDWREPEARFIKATDFWSRIAVTDLCQHRPRLSR